MKSSLVTIAQENLWIGARNGDCVQIRMAIMEGADLRERDHLDRTALNIASQYGHVDAMKTLMAAKQMQYFSDIGANAKETFMDRVFHKRIKKVS